MNPAAKRAARVKRFNDVALGLLFLAGLLLFGWLVLGYLVHLGTMFDGLPWLLL